MKKLNRVQSVVFDTAYNTNENLLICTPTGAGKTNVAMATILREVKQNIKQGVVMKDKFKVCGVATIDGYQGRIQTDASASVKIFTRTRIVNILLKYI